MSSTIASSKDNREDPNAPRRTTVRFEPHTWSKIEAAAQSAGLAPSVFIAKAADAAALQVELRAWKPDDELDDWKAANAAAWRWGDNE